MAMLSDLNTWQKLKQHQQAIANKHLRDLFSDDAARYPRYTQQLNGLLFDYSRNRIDEHTLTLLCQLATECQLQDKINALFRGDLVNNTEKRPALHTALRDMSGATLNVNGENITANIKATQQRMEAFASAIHSQQYVGVTQHPIKNIVNVGIGGSHLGPMMTTVALNAYNKHGLVFYFISTVDKANLDDVLQQVNLEETLFIVSSKTFTTIETMTNARTIAELLQLQLGRDAIKTHMVAITAHKDRAEAFGIVATNIFPMWDWVGGRYSIWSAIGLPLLLQLGIENYRAFLRGGFVMDEHFKLAPFEKNIPVLLGLLGIWYLNFFASPVKAIIPYAHRLRYFIAYLQQAEMESNGKSVCVNGQLAQHQTGTIIFGEEGCNGQHAYHQLLLQGQHLIPADFILFANAHDANDSLHHQIVLASALSQATALMRGKNYQEALGELTQAQCATQEAAWLAHHRVIPGNKPSNILMFDRLTPESLGMLIALYEHKIFVQGAIWNINSFDQWGVELGKQLLPAILHQVQNKSHPTHDLDSATLGLINHFNTVT